MKIGIDIRPLMDAQYSGVSEYTLNLVKEILKLDSNNQYKLFYNSWHDIKSRLPEFKYDNVEVIGLNYSNKILNYLYFKLLSCPKIDQLLDVDLFFMPHLNFIALSEGCKKIITVHDLSFLRYGEFFSFKKNLWHYLLNVRSLLNKFDLIIAQSANTKMDIIELCQVNPDRIKVIYSGVGQEYKQISLAMRDLAKPDNFSAEGAAPAIASDLPDSLRESKRAGAVGRGFASGGQLPIFKFQKNIASVYLNKSNSRSNSVGELISNGLDSKDLSDLIRLVNIKRRYNLPNKFILYLGTLEPRKNIEGIISAYDVLRRKNNLPAQAGELDEVKLIIAGGRGWKSKNILKQWQSSDYKDDIIFLGYVESEDKIYLYNLASVFVYPSFYEGFGYPPLEAMACGLPVITSFSSSLPEVVGEAAIMIDPYNINQIAEAIRQVLTDYELRDGLIKKGLERAKQFSWAKAAGEYLEVFNNPPCKGGLGRL